MKEDRIEREILLFDYLYGQKGDQYFVKDKLVSFLGLAQLPLTERQKINLLEVGCGVGRHSLELAKLGYQVTAIDISHEGINLAEKKARKGNLDINFICQDILKYNPGKQFDLVVFIDTLHHFYYQNINQVIRKIGLLLKTGGNLILIEPNHHYFYNFLVYNLAYWYLKHIKQLGIISFSPTLTQNERSLDPFYLNKLLKQNFHLAKLNFLFYDRSLRKAISPKTNPLLKIIRRLIDLSLLPLPVRYRADHFTMELVKK